MDTKEWIDVSTIIVGIIIFITGIWQYRISQKWKRLEFIAGEIKDFLSDPKVKIVLQMLDWNKRKIELFPDEEKKENRFTIVNDEIVIQALRIEKEDNFSKAELIIRDSFDSFFNYLENFNNYITSELVKYSEFHPHLSYWFNIMINIKSKRKDESFVSVINNFLVKYHFSGVLNLFEKYKEFQIKKGIQ